MDSVTTANEGLSENEQNNQEQQQFIQHSYKSDGNNEILTDNINVDEGIGNSDFGNRLDYNSSIYQDRIWTVIYFIHLGIMLLLLILSWTKKIIHENFINNGFLILFISSVVGAIFGYFWTLLLKKYSGKIIKVMLWGNAILLCISCIICFAIGMIFSGIIWLIFGLLFVIYMWNIQSRIAFAEAMLKISTTIIRNYEGTILIALATLIIQIIWIFWCSTILVNYMSRDNASHFHIFLVVVSFYWNLEILKNISHVTTAGVAAQWYYSQYPSNNATKLSLKRAITTSFGSICFGSTLVSFIHAIKHIITHMRERIDNKIISCIIDCFLSCLEKIIEYFNIYAFSHVAIYGTSYIRSAKNAMLLLKSKGIDALINDDLSGFALLCGSCIGGLICSIISGSAAYFTDSLYKYSITFAFLGFIVGYFLCSTVLNVISSGIATLFVCYAQDPNELHKNHFIEYNIFDQAKLKLFHSEFDHDPPTP